MVVFQALTVSHEHHVLAGVLGFAGRIGLGVAGGAVGVAVVWLLLTKVKLTGILATEAIIATVITIAGFCDAIRDDTGLVAAITMGIAAANLRWAEVPEDRPFLKTVVQLAIGVLFISISATVTPPASLRGVIWPTLGLVALLVLVVRPAAAVRTSLTRNQRIFIGSMDPRGIVAASTAATFTAPLVALHIGGASKLLAVTFLVIVGTVAIYGLAATPLAKALGLRELEPDKCPAEQPP